MTVLLIDITNLNIAEPEPYLSAWAKQLLHAYWWECLLFDLKKIFYSFSWYWELYAETSGSKAEHDEEKLNLFLEEMLEKGSGRLLLRSYFVNNQCPKQSKTFLFLRMFKDIFTVSDGTVASAPGKQKELWQLRERIAEALLKVKDFCLNSQ